MSHIDTLINKYAFKMDSDDASTAALGAGSGLALFHAQDLSTSARRAMTTAKARAIGGGALALLGASAPNVNVAQGNQMMLAAGTNSVTSLMHGVSSKNSLLKQRNGALAAAALLAGLGYAVHKEASLHRKENAKVQAAGGAITGATLGTLLGAAVGYKNAKPGMIRKLLNYIGLTKRRNLLAAAAKGGLLGTAAGVGIGGVGGAIDGAVIGSGVNPSTVNTKSYVENQAKRWAVTGGAVGAAGGIAGGPLGAGAGAAVGAAGASLGGSLKGYLGHKAVYRKNK